MKYVVAFEIDPKLPLERQKQIALGIAFEVNAIGRNDPHVKVDLDHLREGLALPLGNLLGENK